MESKIFNLVDFTQVHDIHDIIKVVILVVLIIFLSFIAIIFLVIMVYTVVLWIVCFISKLCYGDSSTKLPSELPPPYEPPPPYDTRKWDTPFPFIFHFSRFIWFRFVCTLCYAKILCEKCWLPKGRVYNIYTSETSQLF